MIGCKIFLDQWYIKPCILSLSGMQSGFRKGIHILDHVLLLMNIIDSLLMNIIDSYQHNVSPLLFSLNFNYLVENSVQTYT